jgi:hypothetical protein
MADLGYVYVFDNGRLPGLVKIGSAIDVSARLKLANTWSPTDFICQFALRSEMYKGIENFSHFVLKEYHGSHENREFFKVSIDDAIKLLQRFVKLGIAESMSSDFLNEVNGVVVGSSKQVTGKQEKSTFAMLEVPVGSELVYKADPKIVCKTIDDKNQVKTQDGEEVSLSRYASRLKKYSANGYMCFSYNGELLWDIRLRQLLKQVSSELETSEED